MESLLPEVPDVDLDRFAIAIIEEFGGVKGLAEETKKTYDTTKNTKEKTQILLGVWGIMNKFIALNQDSLKDETNMSEAELMEVVFPVLMENPDLAKVLTSHAQEIDIAKTTVVLEGTTGTGSETDRIPEAPQETSTEAEASEPTITEVLETEDSTGEESVDRTGTEKDGSVSHLLRSTEPVKDAKLFSPQSGSRTHYIRLESVREIAGSE
jgi:hypothetical protein